MANTINTTGSVGNVQKYDMGAGLSSADLGSVPSGSQASSGSKQINQTYYEKKALVDSYNDRIFSPLASTINMPKHYGKKITRYKYELIIDDANKNDQGLDANGAFYANGNLYGSSRAVGTIGSALPTLTEDGGRVNRVGITRKTIEGTFKNYGMFTEWTQDAVDFDSDAELEGHFTGELVKASTKLQEDLIQKDLLTNAGTVIYGGSATANSGVDNTCVLTYAMIRKLDEELTKVKVPYETKIIAGSTLTDTRTVGECRIAFCGPETVHALQDMVDQFNRPAFVPVEQYAGATKVLPHEVGKIGKFRVIECADMMYWADGSTTIAPSSGATGVTVQSESSKAKVFPMLVVGDDAFNTIGFQTGDGSAKWKTHMVKPGTNPDRTDPYAKKGFMSIQFWYGFLANRPERIGLLKFSLPV